MTKTTTTRRKKSNKKAEVLDIASNFFLTHGFDGASINVMAREAGISKESIYRYFSSKEELFKAVIEKELEAYQTDMQETASDYQQETLREALMHVAESMLTALTSKRSLALRRLIFQMAAKKSEVGHHYFHAGPEVAYRNLEKILAWHMKNGHLKPQIDPDSMAHYFISMVLHTTMLERECGVLKRISRKEIAKRCEKVVEDFLLLFCEGNGEARASIG